LIFIELAWSSPTVEENVRYAGWSSAWCYGFHLVQRTLCQFEIVLCRTANRLGIARHIANSQLTWLLRSKPRPPVDLPPYRLVGLLYEMIHPRASAAILTLRSRACE
jgi:hypothetical protein